jgi:hypothetical protein
MVMVQLAQLDDTFFGYFVQLENTVSRCLILRYARDSLPAGIACGVLVFHGLPAIEPRSVCPGLL